MTSALTLLSPGMKRVTSVLRPIARTSHVASPDCREAGDNGAHMEPWYLAMVAVPSWPTFTYVLKEGEGTSRRYMPLSNVDPSHFERLWVVIKM